MSGVPLRLIFAGTPEFASVALRALVAAGHDIALVLTQPDRTAGRGLAVKASPVKHAALEHGLQVAQPASLREPALHARFAALTADAMVVAAYGLILPAEVLAIPRLGCLNIHASLLPRWRGAAPIQRALLAGDAETGITIMRMEAGLDTGPMLTRAPLPIDPGDTAGTLHARLAVLGAAEIVAALARPEAAWTEAVIQDNARATYAAKITAADTPVRWSQPAAAIERQIRALDPVPGVSALLPGMPLKLWRANVAAGTGAPGSVLALTNDALTVACGEGALAIYELQRAGGRRLSAGAFAAGARLQPGMCFLRAPA